MICKPMIDGTQVQRLLLAERHEALNCWLALAHQARKLARLTAIIASLFGTAEHQPFANFAGEQLGDAATTGRSGIPGSFNPR
jgi:hypothetical protein